MTRTVPPWVGATDDQVPPPRVRIKLFEAAGGRCQACTRQVGPAREPFEFDHIIPLIAGGANSEANLQVLCRECHKAKTRQDTAEKSKVATIRKKHVLPREKPKSKWKRKLNGEVVLRG